MHLVRQSFSIASMGVTAVKSHEVGKNHSEIAKIKGMLVLEATVVNLSVPGPWAVSKVISSLYLRW